MNQERTLNGKRILVTGGLGCIGSNFIHYILEKYPGIHVTNVDVRQFGFVPHHMHEQTLKKKYRYNYIHGDLCHPRVLTNAFGGDGFDYIVHFAAESHNSRAEKDPERAVHNNISATLALLERARQVMGMKGWRTLQRLLYTSTCEVYGEQELGDAVRPFVEGDPLCPRTKYNITKAAADQMVQVYSRDHGVPTIISRCSNIYGKYQAPEKLISKAARDLFSGERMTLYKASDHLREWTHVLDKCRALELLLTHGALGEVYNIGSGEERSAEQVVKGVLGISSREVDARYGGPEENFIEIVDGRRGHDKRYLLKSSKIQQLGWKPEISFEDGLRETILWYADNRPWWEAFPPVDLERSKAILSPVS